MDIQLVRAGEILFSRLAERVDPVLLKTFDILRDPLCEYDSIVSLCMETNWEMSARISQATSLHLLGQPKWLITTSKFLPQITSPSALEGITLGIFKAANFYDKEWGAETGFNVSLPNVVYQIITCQSDGAKNVRNILSSSYEVDLSNSVKLYVRSDRDKPTRLYDVSRILKSIREDFDSGKLTLETLSPLGTLILDQLLYALFGHLSVSGRMYAMAYLMNEHIDELAEKAKQKK